MPGFHAQGAFLPDLAIDCDEQTPAHVQLMDQLKFARTCQEIKPGDVLPSIRDLARQLNVGDGVVRRAYRELREIGLLVPENRKYVTVAPRVPPGGSDTGRARASIAQCDRLIEWAQRDRVSTIALGRLFLRRARMREAASPSYLFVDICRPSAAESAARISKWWGIKVAGVSLSDFANLGNDNARHVSAVLVNEYLHRDVKEIAGKITPHVFSVKMRVDERLGRRIRRLRARSTVLLVCADDDFERTGRARLQHCADVFGSRWRFKAVKVSDIPDLPGFIQARRYRLVLFTPLLWDTLPGRIKRMVGVAPAFTEPDPQSLEQTRIDAGVLL